MSFLVGCFYFLLVRREHSQLSSRVCLPLSSITPQTTRIGSHEMHTYLYKFTPFNERNTEQKELGSTQNESHSTHLCVRLVEPAVCDGPRETAGWNLHCKYVTYFTQFLPRHSLICTQCVFEWLWEGGGAYLLRGQQLSDVTFIPAAAILHTEQSVLYASFSSTAIHRCKDKHCTNLD